MHIPQTLGTTHAELVTFLVNRWEEWKSAGRFQGGDELHRHVERFVGTLKAIDSGMEELERRAFLVERLCEEPTEYHRTRAEALASYKGRPRRISASRIEITHLRENPRQNPLYLGTIEQQRDSIETILNEGVLNLRKPAVTKFQAWRNACREIEKAANGLEGDGCRYLYHVFNAGEPQSSEGDRMVRAMAEHEEMGGPFLDHMRRAADALVGWAEVSEPGEQPKGSHPERVVLANEDRDKWLYNACTRKVQGQLRTFSLIAKNLKETAPNRRWKIISDPKAIKNAANRWAKRNNKPPVPRRQAGRKLKDPSEQ